MSTKSFSANKTTGFTNLLECEMEIINGGKITDHAGFWVSTVLGPPVSTIWAIGYLMGRYL